MPSTLKQLRRAGYDYMEGFSFGNGQLLGKPVKEAKTIIEDAKIKIKSLHVDLANMSEEDRWKKDIDDAAELGSEYLVCAYLMPNDRKTLDQYKQHAELFNKCGEMAKANGIDFAYHNHDFEFVELEGQAPMNLLLSETDADNVKIELDIYWTRYAGVDPLRFFRNNANRVPLWHVKDLSLDEGKPMTEVGNGIIEWKQIFAYQKDSGLKYFFVEQDRNFKEDSVSSLKTSIKYLKKMTY